MNPYVPGTPNSSPCEVSLFEIGLIHNHPLIEWAVGQALAGAPDMRVHVLGAAGTGPDGPGALPDHLDVLVMDRPPGRSPLTEAAADRAVCVLLMSATGADAGHPGVSGCLSERSDPVALAAAVRAAAVRSRAAADRSRRARTRPARPADDMTLLSAREHQVLRLLARGLTHDQTARRLGISCHTVDTYVKRVRGKLGVGTKAELVRAAMAYGCD
ncbi:LuxR C-terminal-related transcriptional regulator [Streptomyces sp. NBC_00083]|uniref:helix-turn-helix transcriptional regulator n=1 Tax=Streptomyces sp. NBC_00083 TaxID=2975647 RepID=UPI0022541C2A|nr:LuxR C-terminal-related transcriptional regulator [Streptomyces sp. NBC_00083]MCX5383337.1 LuxR C-terminal-related transcriptional regulator [Streptomyces sp. NBC_00083]